MLHYKPETGRQGGHYVRFFVVELEINQRSGDGALT